MALNFRRLIPCLAGAMVVLALACTGAPASTPAASPSPTAAASAQVRPQTSTAQPPGLADVAMAYLTHLADGLGPRESATEEERQAAEYLASQFSGFGYSVQLQPFPVEKLSPEESGLTIQRDGGGTEKVEVAPLTGSSFGQVSGPLALAGLARSEDIPAEGLNGKIALAERGLITFENKARNVTAAGAIGLVIYNNRNGIFRGRLAYSADIPVVSISRSDGLRLEELARDEIDAALSLVLEEVPSRNVIADPPEAGGTRDRVVVVGAHYDTVPNVSGASDNASGTAVVLTMAQALSGESLPFSVRFIAFGSEELGLLGSQAYVASLSDEERGRIVAMLNFDALGSGAGLGVQGDSELTDLVLEQGGLQGIDVEVSPGLQGGSSDHASFAGAGIPVVMFFSDDASRIHTPQDTLESINPALPAGAARLGLGLLDALAESR